MKRKHTEGKNEYGEFIREYNTKRVNAHRLKKLDTRINAGFYFLCLLCLAYAILILFNS